VSVSRIGVHADRDIGTRGFATSADSGQRWHGHERARERGLGGTLGNLVTGFMRLIIPVLLLLALGATSAAYANQDAEVLGNSWMSLGLILLPITFLALHLTNRRYGAGYAFWQVALAWAVGGAIMFGGGENSIARGPSLTREAVGFAAGLFIAQMAAIVIFDRLRGPHWWQAPLMASLFGGLVLCLIAFPAAYAGTSINWTSRMIDYLTLTTMMSIGLLIPYWVMRGFVLPRSGFGGY